MKRLEKRGNYLAPRKISEITILGGIHGNERTGIHVLQIINNNLNTFKSGNIQRIHTILGNPRAIRRNARYIEEDLNRKFQYNYTNPISQNQFADYLQESQSYESRRALEIREEMGALARPVDFLIDLHTTTSNMGNCLIVSDDDPWMDLLCAELASKLRNCRVLFDPISREKDTNSSSLALNSITLEMGPIQQGVPDRRKILEAATIVKEIISSVSALNGLPVNKTKKIHPFHKFTSLRSSFDYPRDRSGVPAAILHPDFNGKDFKPVEMGQDLFIKPDGTAIKLNRGLRIPAKINQFLQQGRTIYPFFIGEAAYIEKGIAFLVAISPTENHH